MRRNDWLRAVLVAVMLALASCAWAQKKTVPLEIQGDTFLVVKSLPFKVVAPAGAADYSWTLPAGVEGTEADNVLTVTKAPQGQFVIKVKTTIIDFDAKKFKKDSGEVTVTLGEAPKPPDPGPGPKPDEAPIKAPGLRVLIVYETGEESKYPAKQAAILYSGTVREWLRANCAVDKDNPNGAYRIWDKDVDTAAAGKPWAEAMQRPRKSVPWIIVSNPAVGGYEGPLPADADAALALMKKYKGQ